MDKREITDTIVIHCTQTPADMDFDVEKLHNGTKIEDLIQSDITI